MRGSKGKGEGALKELPEGLCEEVASVCRALGAEYADARFERMVTESLRVRNGGLDMAVSRQSEGMGVRVLVNGRWGFAAAPGAELMPSRLAQRAVDLARAAALVGEQQVRLDDSPPQRGEFATPMERDPFEVPLGEKVEYLRGCDGEMRAVQGVAVTEATMYYWRQEKWFASTEGAAVHQVLYGSGGGMECSATGPGEVQTRSYPNSHGGNLAHAGYEFIEGLALPENARRTAEEAVALVNGKPCPEGEMDVILGGGQLFLQIHESCGHPIELDRVLGTELSFAGSSFLTVDKLGTFRYGSRHVNITADATLPGSVGSFGYDDEGVPAQRTPIVAGGVLVGYLSSRETAPVIGRRSGGAMRADGWESMPLIRMTNVSLEPGEVALEDLIADTKRGLFMDTNKSWSIDDRRLNFQFATQWAREIVEGRLGALVKNASYSGITPEFWRSCDAVADRSAWRVWGVGNCGKGEPMQVMRVGHGCSPARFRKVRVGVSR